MITAWNQTLEDIDGKLHLFCDFAAVSGRRISKQTVCKCLAETGLYSRRLNCVCPFECIQQERSVTVEPKTLVMDTTIMGACSF
ncbi:hypothetical protein TNCV_4928981 [Trichonephila clavipes]|nr:hypothetical protein TNCV_4928981 [Trichonephila clavipes]